MTELLQETGLSSTQKEYADIIQVSAKSLLSIIDDILDYAKVEAGKMELTEAPFSLLNLLEGILDMLAPRAQGKGLELLLEMPPEVPDRVLGDQDRLRQVVVNLLGNAVKFSDVGETLVAVSVAEEDDEGWLLRFEVRDTGIGIRADDREKIFDVFAQVDGSSTRRHGGTGLGLAISKELVHLFHGDIGVDSEFGKGSTFWFTARFKKATQGVVGDREKMQIDCLKGRRVLVVDDNAAARGVLGTWLMTVGAGSVEEAENGAKAVEMIAQGRFEVVLLDRDMPGLSGVDVIREVAKTDRKRTPFVLMVPVGADDRELPGAVQVLKVHKPLHRQAVLSAMERLVCSACGPVPPTPAKAIQAVNSHAFHVLLAEDNPTNRKVAERMLALLGCSVTAVENGLLAVEAVENDNFDLVLMDCQMPEMDGYSATREIRRRESESNRPRTRIVALTANALASDRERALESGMDFHVAKPIKKADLEKLLVRFGGREGAPKELPN